MVGLEIHIHRIGAEVHGVDQEQPDGRSNAVLTQQESAMAGM